MLIKQCFKSPKGRVMLGADFDSLEDKISALTTRDPSKIKVYTDGYDGHSLRSSVYWPDVMPDIAQDLAEIDKVGKTYRVTLEDGTLKYYNEHSLKDRGYTL